MSSDDNWRKLEVLESLFNGLQVMEDRYGDSYVFYFYDGINQARGLTQNEAEQIKSALPWLIEMARAKQASDDNYDPE